MILKRTNEKGLTFYLSDLGKDKTRIILPKADGKKELIVNHNLEKVDRAWFKWIQQGEMIQAAFLFLTPDEREFLLTGITEAEWKALFGEDS